VAGIRGDLVRGEEPRVVTPRHQGARGDHRILSINVMGRM
jgi:hypothetical protein